MRAKRFLISPQVMADGLMRQGDAVRVVKGLPRSAKLLRAGYDEPTDMFYLTVADGSFEEVEMGEVIPLDEIVLERIQGAANLNEGESKTEERNVKTRKAGR